MIRIMNNGCTARPPSRILVAGAVRRNVNSARVRRHYSIVLALEEDRHRQTPVIALWWANALCFTPVPPERRPSRRGRVQQVVRTDLWRSISEMPLDVWKNWTQNGDPFRCSLFGLLVVH